MPAEILMGAAIAAALFASSAKAINQAQDNAVAALPTFNTFDALFVKYGHQYGIPFVWLKGICMNESSLGQADTVALGLVNPNDVDGSQSDDGLSWGIMQVTLVTARDFDVNVTAVLLNSPDYAVNMACQVLARNKNVFPIVSERYEEYVIKSYNAGAGRVQQMIDSENGVLDLSSAQSAALANAETYWERYLRNKQVITQNQPELAGA